MHPPAPRGPARNDQRREGAGNLWMPGGAFETWGKLGVVMGELQLGEESLRRSCVSEVKVEFVEVDVRGGRPTRISSQMSVPGGGWRWRVLSCRPDTSHRTPRHQPGGYRFRNRRPRTAAAEACRRFDVVSVPLPPAVSEGTAERRHIAFHVGPWFPWRVGILAGSSLDTICVSRDTEAHDVLSSIGGHALHHFHGQSQQAVRPDRRVSTARLHCTRRCRPAHPGGFKLAPTAQPGNRLRHRPWSFYSVCRAFRRLPRRPVKVSNSIRPTGRSRRGERVKW
jgi:hypothetical protein